MVLILGLVLVFPWQSFHHMLDLTFAHTLAPPKCAASIAKTPLDLASAGTFSIASR
jgi:hypothetical protein